MYLVIYYDEAEDKHIGSYLGMFFDNFFLLLSSRNISAACLFNWLVAFVLLKQYLKDIFLCGVIFAYIISQSPERLLLHHTGSQKDKRMKGCYFQVDLLVLRFLVGYQILGSRCMVYMNSVYTGVQARRSPRAGMCHSLWPLSCNTQCHPSLNTFPLKKQISESAQILVFPFQCSKFFMMTTGLRDWLGHKKKIENPS